MKNIKTIFNLIILSIILLFQSNTLMAQENKQDTVKSKMFNNAIYGSVGTLGFYYHVGIYYERMLQKNLPKSKISTFVKVGYGGAVTWDASNQFFSGQYGILTGIKKHHFEGSLGLAFNKPTFNK